MAGRRRRLPVKRSGKTLRPPKGPKELGYPLWHLEIDGVKACLTPLKTILNMDPAVYVEHGFIVCTHRQESAAVKAAGIIRDLVPDVTVVVVPGRCEALTATPGTIQPWMPPRNIKTLGEWRRLKGATQADVLDL